MTPIPPIPEDLQELYATALGRAQYTNGTNFREYMRVKMLIERIAKLTAANEQKETEWWVRLGKFRKALEAANLHGHYNLFQTHFEDESGKWEELEAENTRLKASLEELVESMPAERCTDPNCGGDCGLRLRAEQALSASPEHDEWSRIAPDNMPEPGDEVFDKFGGVRLATEGEISIWENCADGTFLFKRKFKAPLASRATRTPPQEGRG